MPRVRVAFIPSLTIQIVSKPQTKSSTIYQSTIGISMAVTEATNIDSYISKDISFSGIFSWLPQTTSHFTKTETKYVTGFAKTRHIRT